MAHKISIALSNANDKIAYLQKKADKLKAIQALIDGEYDNEHLLKIGPLYPDFKTNVQTILKQ
jgi:hypothetical protein